MPAECEAWPIEGYTPDASVPVEMAALAQQAAERFLRGLTGGKLGICTRVQRFQVRRYLNGACMFPSEGEQAITLPDLPVQSIVDVRVDDVSVDASNYRLLGGKRLVRVGGQWPTSTDSEPGRIQVTYTSGLSLAEGEPYHAAAALAMGEVTREYVNAFLDRPCKLPSRFVSVARQGVTTVALNPSDFLKLGLTGMPLTDNLVNMVNPNRHRRRPRVLSVDGPREN